MTFHELQSGNQTEESLPDARRGYHHGDLRHALIHTALQLIEQHGMRGFTLKDAAKLAGVTPAALYRHFADKQALIAAIHQEGFRYFDEALSAAYHCKSNPKDRLEELGVAYVSFALRHPGHFRVMFGRGIESAQGQPVSNEGFMLLIQAVTELYPNADGPKRHDVVLTCWSFVHGFAVLQMEGAFRVAGDVPSVEPQLRRLLQCLTLSVAIF